MLTFTLRRSGGATEECEYHAVLVNLPGGLMRLALHRDGNMWALSDPASGYRVLTVRGSYKGVMVASATMSLSEARRAARAQFLQLVERVGLDKVRHEFSNARARAFVPAPKVEPSALLEAAKATGKLIVTHVGDAQ